MVAFFLAMMRSVSSFVVAPSRDSHHHSSITKPSSSSSSSSSSLSTPSPFSWRLFEVIEALDENAVPIDPGQGGVRLAQESAIKIVGSVQHKPGQAESLPKDLLRYTRLTSVDFSSSPVQSVWEQTGNVLICSGQGVECYKDPGETTMKEVKYAPMEAIQDSLTNAASAMSSTNLVFNFLGGDDLMLGEVLDAARELVLDLDIPTKTKIRFNSLCHTTIPAGTCTVTVVSVGQNHNNKEGEEADATISNSFVSDVDKAIAAGELYLRDGVYYTVVESDINPAVA
jgi:hypothetical protein